MKYMSFTLYNMKFKLNPNCVYFRENRRILYIKYGGPPIIPANPAERMLQVELKKVINSELSAAAGMVVRLGETFKREGYEDVINTWEPFIKESTNGLYGDLALQYAILHWFARQVCCFTT